VIREGDAQPAVAILSSAQIDETKIQISSPSNAGKKGAQMWSNEGRTHGFAVFEKEDLRKEHLVAGTILDGDSFLSWMGKDPEAEGDYLGVIMGYDPKEGAQVLLRHPEGQGLVLRESPTNGAGFKAGLSGDSAQLGVGPNGPRVLVRDDDGRTAELKPER
jgi:hypothetical protein